VLNQFRTAFLGVALFSALINVLMLTGSFFMLQVYDRVLPSKSIPTLLGLAAIALGLYAFQGVLDVIRSRVLVRIASAFDSGLTERIYEAVIKLPMRGIPAHEVMRPIRDIDAVRSFLSGAGPTALFDLPWMPFFLALCFVFHFYIGVTALVGAALVLGLTLLTEFLSRGAIKDVAQLSALRNSFAEQSRTNGEVLYALGISGRMATLWGELNSQFNDVHRRVSDVVGGLSTCAKVLRFALQSTVLGVGAYLVIQQQATAGIIIASSILFARALAPADIVIANWKGFAAARESWRRLNNLLVAVPPESEVLQLPAPSKDISVENVTVAPPGSQRPVAEGVSFELRAGSALGVIGPSGSGKSSLIRALLGVWPVRSGTVRIDGAELSQWSRDMLGRHIGYLPQDVALCDGTVAENISRFEASPSPDAVIAAAKAAGVHELILTLPEGYETRIGERGEALSAGHRQRIALARALYGEPFLVILDEPNSNLDTEGDMALSKAIRGVCDRGGIVIVIAHRPSVLATVDLVLALVNGRQRAYGRRDEVLTPVPLVPSGVPTQKKILQKSVA
jgi:ATP-binding cassette subfamily C protein